MSAERPTVDDPRMQRALQEMQDLIRGRYPEATFAVTHGEDPEGVWLNATVDVEDPDEVTDLVIERMLALQLDEELPLFVLPLLPAERVAEMLRARPLSRPYARTAALAGTDPAIR